MLRRLTDIAVSSGVLFALLPILTIVWIAIKVSMGSPVFYRHLRVGRGGKSFWLCKFRTMDASRAGSAVTTAEDPRITPLGHILRKWKIDELPQFWNILCGEMSLIGPRPEAEKLVRFYTEEQRQILRRTPGLASMSQLVYPHEVELLRGYADPEQVYLQQLMPRKVAVDLEYEKNRSLLSDLKLIVELALFVVLGKSRHIDSTLSFDSNARSCAGRTKLND